MTEKIFQWGRESLLAHGYILKNAIPEIIQDSPWSYVIRFITTKGYIYLKHMPRLIALEATIIQMLRDQFRISVPEIIAEHSGLNCFLMKDAGKPLRFFLKQQFDVSLIYKAVDVFTAMQITVADHINIFFEIGVPDWRLDKLPDLYMELLSKKDILIKDELSMHEISELENLLPTVMLLCKKLSEYSIKETVVQPDCNDNNILLESNKFTIIDLGEIAISHPFFSLVNLLLQLKKHHGLTNENDDYRQLVHNCLTNFAIFASEKKLFEAFEIAIVLFPIYSALGNYRLFLACDESKFTGSFARHGRPGMALKKFLEMNMHWPSQ